MRQVPVYEGQSWLDISLQEYGTAEGIFALCDANNSHPDELPIPGSTAKIPVFAGANREMTQLIFKRGIIPVTLATNVENEEGETDEAEGINYWAIEGDFIVQPNPGDPEE